MCCARAQELESAAIRRLTPEAVAIVQRMAAASRPACGADAQALEVLTAHVYALVAAAVATAPEDPDRWQARLEAAIVAARDIGRDVRETLRAVAIRERTP